MPNITVKSCAAANTFKTEHGEFQVWKLQIASESGEEMEAKLNTKLGKSGPSIGETFEATLVKGPYGWKAKRVPQNGGGGGSSRPYEPEHIRDPQKVASITRMHCQKVAIEHCKLLHLRGKLPEDFGADTVKKLADFYALDVADYIKVMVS